jgi:hypothetical protein
LVSTIPSASKGISVSSLFLVVEIKTVIGFLASTYHRAAEESRERQSFSGESLTACVTQDIFAQTVRVILDKGLIGL